MAWTDLRKDGTGIGVSVPFAYMTTPVEIGAALDMDVEIYRWVAVEYGIAPSPTMLLLMGSATARELFLRRACCWRDFATAAHARYPDIANRSAVARAAVQALPTICTNKGSDPNTPEVVLGWLLLHCVPIGLPIVRNNPLPGQCGGNAQRGDFGISRGAGLPPLRIEMSGMLDPSGEAVTADGLKYLGRRPDRLRAYAQAGLPPPLVVTCGEVADAARRATVADRVLATLRELPMAH